MKQDITKVQSTVMKGNNVSHLISKYLKSLKLNMISVLRV